MGFSMQGNYKTREGADHPDRDAQFHYINDTVAGALAAQQPVISVDTKKKELVGDFKNGGREWARKGEPVEVNTHDFPSHAKGKATPYGVYDITHNEGYVSVGISADTAAFAASSIRAWWQHLGQKRHPNAEILTDHRRCRRVQQPPRTVVAGRAWEAGQPDRDPDQGAALPARDLEVEPDRASHVQLHHDQLARQAADQLPGDHQPDRRDDHDHRAQGLRTAG